MYNCTRDQQEQFFQYAQPTRAQQELLGLYTDSIDLHFTAQRLAAESSAEYLYNSSMHQTARAFANDCELHSWVAAQVTNPGLWLEFGVARGRTINHFAEYTSSIHGFDSFEGLPEQWRADFPRGAFAQAVPAVKDTVTLHCGWFEDTLPGFLEEYKDNIAFLHIDSDLYSSARYVLDNLHTRLQAGSIILFDEYFNHPTWQQDEFRAWQEIVQQYNYNYTYIAYNPRHQQVAICIN